MVESRLLNRRGIGVDIDRDAVMLAHDRLNFTIEEEVDEKELSRRAGEAGGPGSHWGDLKPRRLARTTTPSSSSSSSSASSRQLGEIQLYCGDARNLDAIKDETVDLIATHPPYAGIIKYTGDRVPGDLSAEKGLDGFLRGMRAVAGESLRVLKPGKHCAVLMGDTRKHKHYIPIAFRTMQQFLDAGFVLREDIIRRRRGVQGSAARLSERASSPLQDEDHPREVARLEVRLLPAGARAPVRLPQARAGRVALGVQAEPEVVVSE